MVGSLAMVMEVWTSAEIAILMISANLVLMCKGVWFLREAEVGLFS
jgi:hypothetical protein